MSRLTKDEVISEANKLAKLIADTKEVERFKICEAKMNENDHVQMLMKKLKRQQQEAVNLEHLQKEGALSAKEEEINQVLEDLDQIPIVNEFKDAQNDVNALLQLVATTISNRVTDEIIKQTQGDLLRGETGSKVAYKKG